MSTTGGEPPNEPADKATEHPEGRATEENLELALRLSAGQTLLLPTRFSYHVNDPYAVHLRFCRETQGPAHRVFARALLTAGMYDPVGAGDVRVWPGNDRTLVYMYLASPHGCAQLEIPAAPLADWLLRIYRLVPLGQENRHLDFDALVGRLLRERGPEPPPPHA